MQHPGTNLAGDPANDSTPLISGNMGFLGGVCSPAFEMLSSAQPSPALMQHADNVASWIARQSPAMPNLQYGPLISPALGFINPFQTKHWNTPAETPSMNPNRQYENALFTPLIEDSAYDASIPLITDADQVFYSPADLLNATLNSPQFYVPGWAERAVDASSSLFAPTQPSFQDCMGSPLVSLNTEPQQSTESLIQTSANTPLLSALNHGDLTDFTSYNSGYFMPQYQDLNFGASQNRNPPFNEASSPCLHQTQTIIQLKLR
ncbi:hypothetical protein DSO57_1017140 [Entomophthora muscae]|uniref:Uncharacterized protein n=1 Tax=Entomophthora muscae TaxID=34485 RepID=A0ACC2RJ71_9FUNG|nr:hypothetical protein DSO57_1017140 [Entomophthora muscae]